MKTALVFLSVFVYFCAHPGISLGVLPPTPTVSPSPIPTASATPRQSPDGIGTTRASDSTGGLVTGAPTATSAPNWVPAPLPKEESRLITFTVTSAYKSDTSGSNLFSIGDLYAKRKLDEYSVTTDLMLRFEKNLSNNDSADNIDLRLARISLLEPFFQLTVGRLDLYPVLTPMSFFGAYSDMGLHRVDGALVVLPIFLQFGIENYETYTAPPTALTFFYSPSLLSAQYVVLDTSQSFFLAQARTKFDLFGLETSMRINTAWTSTDYFTDSSFNGNLALSFDGEVNLNKNCSLYGEYGVQNTSLFNETSVLGLGAKAMRIATLGPFSFDSALAEIQIPMSSDPTNPFDGGNSFDPSSAQTPTLTWYGELKARVQIINLVFSITNNLDDYTLNRITPDNSPYAFTGPFGPGRETDKTQIPLEAMSSSQPGFLITAGVDF